MTTPQKNKAVRRSITPTALPAPDIEIGLRRPVLILATKCDKLGKNAQREALAAIVGQVGARYRHGNVIVQLFSATTRQGVEEAEAIIDSWL